MRGSEISYLQYTIIPPKIIKGFWIIYSYGSYLLVFLDHCAIVVMTEIIDLLPSYQTALMELEIGIR
jgi:hypothetical protein